MKRALISFLIVGLLITIITGCPGPSDPVTNYTYTVSSAGGNRPEGFVVGSWAQPPAWAVTWMQQTGTSGTSTGKNIDQVYNLTQNGRSILLQNGSVFYTYTTGMPGYGCWVIATRE